jgi:hypothetical protein
VQFCTDSSWQLAVGSVQREPARQPIRFPAALLCSPSRRNSERLLASVDRGATKLPGKWSQLKSTFPAKARSVAPAGRQRKVFGFSINVLIGAHPGNPLSPPKRRAKGNHMALPAILQGDSITRLLQGAAVGAVATLVIGFNWGGWVTGGTAKEMTQKSVSTALVSALSPVCVEKFEHSADAASNLVEFKKVSSWQQGSFIEKGGWATIPGGESANAAVAQACATMLGSLQN